MKRTHLLPGALLVVAILAILASLFGASFPVRSGFAGGWVREIEAALRDPVVMAMALTCLAAYSGLFVFLQLRRPGRWAVWAAVSLGLFLAIAALSFVLDFAHAVRSPRALVLLWSITVGLATGMLSRRESPGIRNLLVSLVGISLLIACFWHPQSGVNFEYRGHSRWMGPWDNPNLYGLLMAAGAMIALGGGLTGFGFIRQRSLGEEKSETPYVVSYGVFSAVGAFICAVAAALFMRGVFQSYSRGAWVAAGCGLSYLAWQVASANRNRLPILRLKRIAPAVVVILASLAVLAFWHGRDTNMTFGRRALSVGNLNDFSWRNRVAAWEGALQMMVENPVTGLGWNRVETTYESYYLQPRLTESAAIQMNDPLALGAMLGIPALFCFGLGVWFRLGEPVGTGASNSSGRPGGLSEAGSSNPDWVKAGCRAGAIVLLVGFWFDGGLFKLATATMFWVLLELGSAAGTQSDGRGESRERGASPMGLRAERAWGWGRLRAWGMVKHPACFLVVGMFASALWWAAARDPYSRVAFSLKTSAGAVHGIAVIPRDPEHGRSDFAGDIRERPTVIYLQGSGKSLMSSGKELRLLAELGMTAVGLDYNQTNQAIFDAQFATLHRYLRDQKWAGGEGAGHLPKTAWIGSSLGAQRQLSFLLRNPEHAPDLVVRAGGGWVDEADTEEDLRRDGTPESFTPTLMHEGGREEGGGKLDSSVQTRLAALRQMEMIRLPRFLLIQGEQDNVFPVNDCHRLAAFLKGNGASADVRILTGQNHGFGLNADTVLRGAGEYSARVLRGGGTPVPNGQGWLRPLEVNVRSLKLWCWFPFGLLAGAMFTRRYFAWRATMTGPRGNMGMIVLCLAYGLGLLAAVETAVRLGLPRLAVSESRVNLAKRWIASGSLKEDFDFMAKRILQESQAAGHGGGCKIGDILEHVQLANYNRQLVNWTAGEGLYRDFVLSPFVDALSVRGRSLSDDMGWRRPLWENFYPRIRKEVDPSSAAEIIANFLRERVSVFAGEAGPGSILGIWEQGFTDQMGFERIYVAALRSTGIPSRLGSAGQAELFSDSRWQPAPRPVLDLFLP